MTNKQIIETIKNEVSEQLKYNTLDKLSRSPYYDIRRKEAVISDFHDRKGVSI